jgi:hypothetical protein
VSGLDTYNPTCQPNIVFSVSFFSFFFFSFLLTFSPFQCSRESHRASRRPRHRRAPAALAVPFPSSARPLSELRRPLPELRRPAPHQIPAARAAYRPGSTASTPSASAICRFREGRRRLLRRKGGAAPTAEEIGRGSAGC